MVVIGVGTTDDRRKVAGRLGREMNYVEPLRRLALNDAEFVRTCTGGATPGWLGRMILAGSSP